LTNAIAKSPGSRHRWAEHAERVSREFGTPVYLFAWEPVADQLRELSLALTGLPVKSWYSFKTCPLPILLDQWRRVGHAVEVVSEFELQAAIRIGFLPKQILVNGVAKHTWLPRHRIEGLRVNFDSVTEIRALDTIACDLGWSVGLRFHPHAQRDPDNEQFPDQFGIPRSDMGKAVELLRDRGLALSCVHMHLRSNVLAATLAAALEELSKTIDATGMQPLVLNVGGGLAAAGVVVQMQGDDFLTLTTLSPILRGALDRMPSVREVWLENGRYLLAPAGVLVVRVNDIKEHDGLRHLICDGGRTNHALVSDWETHAVSTVPSRNGATVPTVVCGPTCMAFDHLFRGPLPRAIEVGDLLVWHDAGAYHLPWETRFSHGLAPVVFLDQTGVQHLARARESFNDWWALWSRTRI
jgi:diaminopimelate decarboxylase